MFKDVFGEKMTLFYSYFKSLSNDVVKKHDKLMH